MGGSSPPVHATLTLKPSPAPEPTYNENMWKWIEYLRFKVLKIYLKLRDVPHLSRWPTAREEVPIVIAMKWDVENTLVTVEDFLGAVTMVNILPSTTRRTFYTVNVVNVGKIKWCKTDIKIHSHRWTTRAVLPSQLWGSCWRWAWAEAAWQLLLLNWSNRNPWRDRHRLR